MFLKYSVFIGAFKLQKAIKDQCQLTFQYYYTFFYHV